MPAIPGTLKPHLYELTPTLVGNINPFLYNSREEFQLAWSEYLMDAMFEA